MAAFGGEKGDRMNFFRIGSVNQYVRGLARQTQWSLKQKNGDYAGHRGSLQEYVTFTRASALLPQSEERDDKLSAIVTKAEAGKKLSQEEWDYLRVKNPTLYAHLRELEEEQKGYEKALRRCKTRDEAQRLHVSKLGEVMTAAKNGDAGALLRLNRLTRTMNAFTSGSHYRRLPTEAQQAVEREREREARQEALRRELEENESARRAVHAEAEPGAGQTEKIFPEPETAGENAERDALPPSRTSSRPSGPPKAEFSPADSTGVSHRPGGRAASTVPSAAGQSTEQSAVSALAYGQRAYLLHSDAHARRKVFDAEA